MSKCKEKQREKWKKMQVSSSDKTVWRLVLPFVVSVGAADGDGGLSALLTLAAVSRTLRGLVAADERVWRTLCLRRALRRPTCATTPPALGFDRSWLRSFWSGSPRRGAGGPEPTSLPAAAAKQGSSSCELGHNRVRLAKDSLTIRSFSRCPCGSTPAREDSTRHGRRQAQRGRRG